MKTSHQTTRANLPAFLSLANADRTPVLPGGGDLRPGEIYALGNDSRFLETNFSEPLTTFATGWRDPNNIESTLEFFAPKTPVPSRLFEFKQAVNAEEFFSETDDIRAIGADFKRIEYTGGDVVDKTLNKGLTMRIDLDNVNTRIAGWENRFIGKMLRRLMRNDLRRAITLLSAAATNTAKTWDATADPDAEVVNEMVAAGDAVGFAFNRVGYGHSAWATRFTPQQLADMLNVDQVYVSRERYQSTATGKSEILGNIVLMFYAAAGMDTEDPSNIKRFVSPPPNVIAGGSEFARPAGGLDVNVYLQQVSSKLVDITVEHYSKVVMTSTLGVNQFTITA